MPHSTETPLRPSDFRQHPATEFSQPHWLTNTIYGRHLLKTKLRQTRPDLQVLMIRYQPEYEPLLEAMVDVLDLRGWPEPETASERLKALRAILRTTFELSEFGQPPADGATGDEGAPTDQ
jgi:hypothetical protein